MSESSKHCPKVLNHRVLGIQEQEIDLCQYRDKVLLIVNTASKCGFTGQYDDLQKLHTRFQSKGFEVLAFPSNDFANQEPATNQEIAEFCSLSYSTTFPLFAKVHVKGKEQAAIYRDLAAAKGAVLWNFQKYLIDRKGEVVAKYNPWTNPLSDKIQKEIQRYL